MNLNDKALIVSEDEYFYLINNYPDLFRVSSSDAGYKKKGWVGKSKVVRIMHLTKEGFFLGFDTRIDGVRPEMQDRAKGWVFDQLGLYHEEREGLIDLPYTCARAVDEIRANNPDLKIDEVFNLNDDYTAYAGFVIGKVQYDVYLKQVYNEPDWIHSFAEDKSICQESVIMYRWGMANDVLLLGIPQPDLQRVNAKELT